MVVMVVVTVVMMVMVVAVVVVMVAVMVVMVMAAAMVVVAVVVIIVMVVKMVIETSFLGIRIKINKRCGAQTAFYKSGPSEDVKSTMDTVQSRGSSPACGRPGQPGTLLRKARLPNWLAWSWVSSC